MSDAAFNRSHVTVATVAGFAGILLGLLAPVYMFAQRLTIQEERLAALVTSVSGLRTDIQKQSEGLSTLQLTLAERGIPTTGKRR